MYNSIFGVNPAASILLAMIGQDASSVGRFRDVFVREHEGRPVIAVYTRNGGGNRSGCDHIGAGAKYGNERCRHHVMPEERDQTAFLPKGETPPVGWRQTNVVYGDRGMLYTTGQREVVDLYVCDAPESIECACTSCTMNYRIPAMEGYLYDADDDFDGTYNTAYFDTSEEWRGLLVSLVRNTTPQDDWKEFLEALKNPPESPKTRNEQLAVSMIAGIKDAAERKEKNGH